MFISGFPHFIPAPDMKILQLKRFSCLFAVSLLPLAVQQASATTEWQSTGTVTVSAAAPTVVLSAGAQLTQSNTTGEVSVRIVSRPYFSLEPSGWQSLEVGPASLTFVRDEAAGAMVLLGDRPLSLPFGIQLDSEGRSITPLDLVLRYSVSQSEAALLIENQTITLQATATPGAALEIALTAGATASWTIDLVEVQAFPSDSEPPPDESTDTSDATSDSTTATTRAEIAAFLQKRREARTAAMEHFQAGDLAAGEAALIGGLRDDPETYDGKLELAGRLTHLALVLRQKYDYRGALALAQRARTILFEAEALGAPIGSRRGSGGRIHEMAGFIAERLLYDSAAARTAYERARDVNPDSQRAREGLARLTEAEAKSERVATRQALAKEARR